MPLSMHCNICMNVDTDTHIHVLYEQPFNIFKTCYQSHTHCLCMHSTFKTHSQEHIRKGDAMLCNDRHASKAASTPTQKLNAQIMFVCLFIRYACKTESSQPSWKKGPTSRSRNFSRKHFTHSQARKFIQLQRLIERCFLHGLFGMLLRP